ncbi:NAD(P)H-dependent oxidoreductase [Gordonia liuliyuniae]|uniref:NAD(P)H-dependent oxidoreductase n=1 Tax=Gordonia liuliyuniae TaxID=2911517 RepID=A0ABS9IWW5_9ACTN|nr:NAD(P)H-dependent oxidoreductase [Gordonia liuliyuniae]MCF8590053.1 NAD(P)H-dependent oxidoreductase [Gordonia liuliyuniae]
MSDNNLTVAVLVGSLRAESINRQLAEVALENLPEGVSGSIVEGLGDLAFYNEDIDIEGALPAGVAQLREAVGAADAVLLVTPEYNGTLPAVLKNAIDWLSRPYGAGAMVGKSVGVIGAALGQYAGTWSRQDTRKSAGIAGGRVVEEVEIGVATGKLDDAGVRTDEIVGQVGEAVRVLVDSVAVAV